MTFDRKRKTTSKELEKALSQVAQQKQSQIHFYLPEKLHTKLKVLAAAKKVYVTDIMIELIEGYLSKTK